MSDDSSELTELTSDMDVDVQPTPSAVQKAYEYAVPLMKQFDKMVDECAKLESIKTDFKTLFEKAQTSRKYTVAIIGRTGLFVGKSTLLNALLQNQVLSASASGACTAVTTEVSYKDVPYTEAVIEFISREDWRQELTRLIEDATDKTIDSTEIAGELPDHISPAHQAKEKLLGVFPQLREDGAVWTAERLLEDEEVNHYLDDGSVAFDSSSATNFQKQIEKFIASALSSSRVFWPLVKRVSLMGKFDVLSTGITLVDLPGHGDIDSARDGMASNYLQHADLICLVSGVNRAKDDSDVQSRLYKTLHQIIQDGRVHEKSIALILTGADAKIGSNEVTLVPEEQQIVDSLTSEAIALGEEIAELQAKRDKKARSKSSKSQKIIDGLQAQINQKEQHRDLKNKERGRLQANGRNRIVADALQDKYKQLYLDLMCKNNGEAVEVPPVPIFCLGSRDYLCLANLEPDKPITFSDPEETEIPKLKRHLLQDGERRNLVEAISTIGNFCRMLSQASTLDANPTSDIHINQEIIQLLTELEKKCDARRKELLVQIEAEYAKIGQALREAVDEAMERSPGVFAHLAEKLKWNQYRAMMRSNGSYVAHPPGSLNSDLVASIKPRVGNAWAVGVNNEIPLHLLNFYNDVEDEYVDAIKQICTKSNKYNNHRVTKTVGFETIITELNKDNRAAAQGAQRQGSRVWDSEVRKQLSPQYQKVCSEKGNGMFKRMKASNKAFIDTESNRIRIFGDITRTVDTSFEDCLKVIDGQITTALDRLRLNIRTACFGAKTTAFRNPQQEAEAQAKAFGQAHEDPTIFMLDSLKSRLQEIS